MKNEGKIVKRGLREQKERDLLEREGKGRIEEKCMKRKGRLDEELGRMLSTRHVVLR